MEEKFLYTQTLTGPPDSVRSFQNTEMHLTGTQFNYYLICHRKLWLFSKGINMEHTSELVYEGKLIHENSYPRRSDQYTEIEIDGIKIDFYDPRNKIIHEIKKSDFFEDAHEWQIKYYIYVMKRNGIKDVSGILEYPKMRESRKIEFSGADEETLERMKSEIRTIVQSETCPPRKPITKCKNCSYMDFCWSGEEEKV